MGAFRPNTEGKLFLHPWTDRLNEAHKLIPGNPNSRRMASTFGVITPRFSATNGNSFNSVVRYRSRPAME